MFTTVVSGSNGRPNTILADSVVEHEATNLVDHFAFADLVVGNDTGLTHLAASSAFSDAPPPLVCSLHSRHSPTKWNVGSCNHIGVGTTFTFKLTAQDLCPIRDEIDEFAHGSSMQLIDPKAVAQLLHRLVFQLGPRQ